ncbi:MAG TPA: hypothetical protein VKB30_09840 [Candidatus Limnocylindrales bacterium]|nr:hypothetical protein [Candidatus Limnocylindrales bacterium]
MPKTATPGTIEIPGIDTFAANAMPDPFDARDLVYRPRLDVLPQQVDGREGRHVYRQIGQSCTGHAVAALINHVLKARAARSRVSPYMLYRLARRYDEFPGDADAGSSLRGAFKGWFNHGAALEHVWPALDLEPEPDVDDPQNLASWRDRPLGAFYRVNAFRLDDVQSAITELNALAVSGVIHEGWKSPVRRRKGSQTVHVISRPVDARVVGGHAYCLVGYNEIGFLVQNSWGEDWGSGGFATLPYEDWLDSAYDAWVARPGVPQTPFYSGRSRTAVGTGGELVTAAAPDLRRLAYHVVNTGNDGALSSTGKFVSTPAQVDRVVEHMGAWHEFMLHRETSTARHVVLWAHGGGVAEQSGLQVAQRHLNWWLNQGVYPITMVWETGPFETLRSALEDVVRGVLPAGGVGFDLVEQLDRLVEGICRRRLRWAWREMKENAERASVGVPGSPVVPGARLLVEKLAAYVAGHGAGNVRIHLAGHSAGSVYQAAMLGALADAGLEVDTLTWLAPAITVDRFRERVLPHLGPRGNVRHFSCFNLSDALELDDAIEPVYHKSAVYLVARGLEDDLDGVMSEVPVLGLTKHWTTPGPDGRTLLEDVEARGGQLIIARSAAANDARTDAMTHASFDEDSPTMTSVAMRVLGVRSNPDTHAYQPYAALRDPDHAPWSAAAGALHVGPSPTEAGGPDRSDGATRATPASAERGSRRRNRDVRPGTPIDGAPPMGVPPPMAGGPRMSAAPPPDDDLTSAAGAPPAEVLAPGASPLVVSTDGAEASPRAPRSGAADEPIPEVAVAPRSGSPILDILAATGWEAVD